MRVRVAGASDVGRVRERNEDSYLVDDPLFAVADGLGGHQGGEVASAVALETLGQAAAASDGEARIRDKLRDGVLDANRAVFERAAGDSALSGMGTTLTALVAGAGRFHLAHVGDSRAYLLRDGDLSPLTEDHTLVRKLVREGRLTPEEAEIHPQRSILTRALGIDDDVEVDQATVEIRPGDRLLLCSDGLTSMVPDDRIHELLSGQDPDTTCRALIEAANAAGGQDNVTVVVLDVVDTEDPPATIPAEAASPGVRARPRASAHPRRRRGRRALLWTVVVVILLGAGLFGWRSYADRQWFVGVHQGRVALYRGVPVEVLGIDQFTLVEETLLSSTEARRLQPWSELDGGITAGSEAEARQIIAQIEQDLAPPPAMATP